MPLYAVLVSSMLHWVNHSYAPYLGNGIVCSDVDECLTSNGGCSADAVCANSVGSRSCTCKVGYTGNGTSCTDINECTMGIHKCSQYANCSNTVGSYSCACNSGYQGDNYSLWCFLSLRKVLEGKPSPTQIFVYITLLEFLIGECVICYGYSLFYLVHETCSRNLSTIAVKYKWEQ